MTNPYDEFNVFNGSCSSSFHGVIDISRVWRRNLTQTLHVGSIFCCSTMTLQRSLIMVFKNLLWQSNECKTSQLPEFKEREKESKYWSSLISSRPIEEACLKQSSLGNKKPQGLLCVKKDIISAARASAWPVVLVQVSWIALRKVICSLCPTLTVRNRNEMKN